MDDVRRLSRSTFHVGLLAWPTVACCNASASAWFISVIFSRLKMTQLDHPCSGNHNPTELTVGLLVPKFEIRGLCTSHLSLQQYYLKMFHNHAGL